MPRSVSTTPLVTLTDMQVHPAPIVVEEELWEATGQREYEGVACPRPIDAERDGAAAALTLMNHLIRPGELKANQLRNSAATTELAMQHCLLLCSGTKAI